MKVAYFIGSLNRGGTEMLLLDICQRKKYAPFEMIIIYRNDGELTNEFRSTGVKMIRIKPIGLQSGYYIQLRRLLKKEMVNILHTQTLTNALIGVISTCFSSIRLVASFHGFYRSWKQFFFRQIVMWNADALVFVSRFFHDWYIKKSFFCPRSHSYVVHNGINFDKIDLRYPEPNFLIEEKKNKPDAVKMVMVGNFSSTRSQLVICRSIKLLIDQGINNFDFYFVGKRLETDTVRYDECVNYCSKENLLEYVHFMGGRGDVPAILQYVDAFVYSTNHDTFGIAVVEALASGLPVVVNDWKVMKEIICDKEWATFFRSQDEVDCCEKMKELINNIASRKIMAQRNKSEIRKTYSIENHIYNLTKVYEQVCNVKI